MTRKEVIKSYKIAIKGLLDTRNYDVVKHNKIKIELNNLIIDIIGLSLSYDIYIMVRVTKEQLNFNVPKFTKLGKSISNAFNFYYEESTKQILPLVKERFKGEYNVVRGQFTNVLTNVLDNFKIYWSNGTIYINFFNTGKDVTVKLGKRSEIVKTIRRLIKERKDIINDEKQKELNTLYTKLFEEI